MRIINSKVVVIGAGKVGSTVAYTLMMSRLVSEIVLIDVDLDRARGEALDISHGIAFFQQIIVREGDYTDCADADMIIITAGIGRRPGQTRIDLARTNVAIIRKIMDGIMRYAVNPLLLVISNPVDILTYLIQKETGLPPSRIIGSGTMLDTGRFRYHLSKHCQVDVRNVHAYIIGEHGDNSVPIWSNVIIASKSFDAYCNDRDNNCNVTNKASIYETVRESGTEIIKSKGATFYGIALATSRIVESILGDENTVLPLSSSLYGAYGIYDVALSLPCVVNQRGIDRYLSLRISDEEKSQLDAAAEKLRNAINNVL